MTEIRGQGVTPTNDKEIEADMIKKKEDMIHFKIQGIEVQCKEEIIQITLQQALTKDLIQTCNTEEIENTMEVAEDLIVIVVVEITIVDSTIIEKIKTLIEISLSHTHKKEMQNHN